jgi:hypothetical protein
MEFDCTVHPPQLHLRAYEHIQIKYGCEELLLFAVPKKEKCTGCYFEEICCDEKTAISNYCRDIIFIAEGGIQ